jgi:hypothetical protein
MVASNCSCSYGGKRRKGEWEKREEGEVREGEENNNMGRLNTRSEGGSPNLSSGPLTRNSNGESPQAD